MTLSCFRAANDTRLTVHSSVAANEYLLVIIAFCICICRTVHLLDSA